MKKTELIIKGIVSFSGLLIVGYILSACIDQGIDGRIISGGLCLIGFFVGLIFDVNIFKRKEKK